MAKKPEGDLGGMTITKARAAETVPFASVASPAATPTGGVKSLTVKLEADLYATLLAYCYQAAMAQGSRVTHQHVMVKALESYLTGQT